MPHARRLTALEDSGLGETDAVRCGRLVAKRPTPQPWHPAPYDEADTGAIKALFAGNANAGQQQRALAWIINVLCGTYDQPYRPGEGGDRDTVFACAKQFIGQQIVKQSKITTSSKPQTQDRV